MRKAIKSFEYEVAAACGYIPEIKVAPWIQRWNRLRLWLIPGCPPRLKVWKNADDLPPLSPECFDTRGFRRGNDPVLNAQLNAADAVLNQQQWEADLFWHNYDANPVNITDKEIAPGSSIYSVNGVDALEMYERMKLSK
jgi:hypothetical protein